MFLYVFCFFLWYFLWNVFKILVTLSLRNFITRNRQLLTNFFFNFRASDLQASAGQHLWRETSCRLWTGGRCRAWTSVFLMPGRRMCPSDCWSGCSDRWHGSWQPLCTRPLQGCHFWRHQTKAHLVLIAKSQGSDQFCRPFWQCCHPGSGISQRPWDAHTVSYPILCRCRRWSHKTTSIFQTLGCWCWSFVVLDPWGCSCSTPESVTLKLRQTKTPMLGNKEDSQSGNTYLDPCDPTFPNFFHWTGQTHFSDSSDEVFGGESSIGEELTQCQLGRLLGKSEFLSEQLQSASNSLMEVTAYFPMVFQRQASCRNNNWTSAKFQSFTRVQETSHYSGKINKAT